MSWSWLQIGLGAWKEGRKETERRSVQPGLSHFRRTRGLDAQRSQVVPAKASGSAAVELVLSDSTVGKATERLILSAGTDESLYSIPGNLHAISIRVKNGQFLYPV